MGALVTICGLFLWFQPVLRYFFGILIILLALTSFVTSDFGGLFVGMLTGIVGGSLAVAWVPAPPQSRKQARQASSIAASENAAEPPISSAEFLEARLGSPGAPPSDRPASGPEA